MARRGWMGMQPPEQFVLRQVKYHPLPAGDRFQGLYLEGLGQLLYT